MNILIVSILHEFQLDDGELASAELRQLRDNLEALLQKKIAERIVEFIGEETDWKSKHSTIAQRLANKRTPQIPWKNVDMTEEERKTAGIYEALKNRPYRVVWRGDKTVAIFRRIPEDDIREEFMVSRAIEYAGNAESVLILCGDMHTGALKKKFEHREHLVEADESLITEKDWEDV